MPSHDPASGRLIKAPENFIDPDGVRQVFREGKAGRRDFVRNAFAAAVAGFQPLGLAIPRRIGKTGVAARFGLDRLERGTDAVAKRFEPVARRLLLRVERGHDGKPFVCLSASASAMPAATATFKDRKPGCIGIATRAATASWT